MDNLRPALLLALSGWAGSTLADIWTEPNPLRREALVDGRDFSYGSEAFLNRLSYHHLSDQPTTDRDGVRGTAGSVTGDELFVDIHLQKTLDFTDERHAVILRMQRFEDFDGRFDRQIVGFARRLGNDWRIALAGDVRGSKAETDIQLEASWTPDAARLLRLTYIRPEAFYNEKGADSSRYRDEPQIWFLHYRNRPDGGIHTEIAINLSPSATFEDPQAGLLAEGRQLRLMANGSLPARDWRLSARIELEDTDRSFDWRDPPAADADQFRRRMHAVDVSARLGLHRLAPTVGARHFRLEEDGWLGASTASTGRIRHDEVTLYASLTFTRGDRHSWQPTVYLSDIDADRALDLQPARSRSKSGFAGKLALPWRYTVNEAQGAVLTVNPTLKLHEMAFGGGNVQLHWPL